MQRQHADIYKDGSTGMTVFYSSFTELLVSVLLANIRQDRQRRNDPFEKTVIVVPNSGMQRYLELNIAKAFGICSQIDIVFPSRYLTCRYKQVLGKDIDVPAYADRRSITFELLALWQQYDDGLACRNHQALDDLLRQYGKPRQRYELAETLAQLFSQYLNERPELVGDWRNNRLHYQGKCEHEAWQMALFQQLQLGQYDRSDVQRQFHRHLTTSSSDNRQSAVHLFGFHLLPPVQLSDFLALSEYGKVFAYLFNPSISYWQDIVPASVKMAVTLTAESEADLLSVGHPLLASWGQAGKFLISAIDNNDGEVELLDDTLQATDLSANPRSVLSWLQAGIRDLGGNADALKQAVTETVSNDAADDANSFELPGLSIHIAASARREVEILYDRLCQLFEQRRDINPSDVLVMVPRLSDYAPHIEAIFGHHGDKAQAAIPFSLANQTAAEADIESQALLSLLTVIDKQFQAQPLFDCLANSCVRRAFDLKQQDLETIHYWLVSHHFAGRYVDDNDGNGSGNGSSLEKLLDSLLLASVGGDDCKIADDSDRVALAAYQDSQRESLQKFCQLLPAFEAMHHLRNKRQCLADWYDDVKQLVEIFLGDSPTMKKRLKDWFSSISQVGNEAQFDFDTIITDIRRVFESEELRGPFLSGGISFCAMIPMRSIPAKIICLLGMNQDFPAIVPKHPLDLRTVKPLWSDRNINKEYKYFALETLMATREKCYLSYVGQDEQTGKRLPASVLVNELLAWIEQHFPGFGKKITYHYPLQGFLPSKQQVTYQPLYKRVDQEHFEQSGHFNGGNAQFVDFPVQFKATEIVDALLEPLNFYLNKRWGVSPIRRSDNQLAEHDMIAFETGLDHWRYQNCVIAEQLFGHDITRQLKANNRYAPEPISQRLLAKQRDKLTPLIDEIKPWATLDNHRLRQFVSHDFNGKTVHCLIDVENNTAQGLWDYKAGNLHAKKWLRFWVNHVLLNNLSTHNLSAHSISTRTNGQSQLFVLNNNCQVKRFTLNAFATQSAAQDALSDLLSVVNLLFEQPFSTALKLSQPRDQAPELSIQPQQNSLYPDLMQQAQHSDLSAFKQGILTINDRIASVYGAGVYGGSRT
ncbi:MAG: hypothetical protein CSA47_00375 [Gammaproteobacteria bacterium]|nr:MAG: hypothetical protein CSA47_00375 [Gammaproteobacteria bacterium]